MVSALGFEDLLRLSHNWSFQRESRITAKYFIESIIQQLPREAKRERNGDESEKVGGEGEIQRERENTESAITFPKTGRVTIVTGDDCHMMRRSGAEGGDL